VSGTSSGCRRLKTEPLGDVRCWGLSGKHMLALSFSGFDPKPTLERTREI
jgi:hypothetical protein